MIHVVRRSVLLLVFSTATLASAADTIQRVVALPPDVAFQVLTSGWCVDKISPQQLSCEGQLLDPEKLGKTTVGKARVTTVAGATTISITTDKPKAASFVLDALAAEVSNNERLKDIGRTAPVSPAEVATIFEWAKPLKTVEVSIGSYERDTNFGGSLLKMPTSYGTVLTPALRVAALAVKAAAEYKPLNAGQLSPEVLSPVTWLDVRPFDRGEFFPSTARLVNVKTVVLLPNDSKDASQAVQALWSKPSGETWKNALGLTVNVSGLTAAFPTNELRQGRDVVIVYESGDERRLPITGGRLLQWMLLQTGSR